jgi:hypothetical protein
MEKTIDFGDLREEVMSYWEDINRSWCRTENVGYESPDPVHHEIVPEQWAEDILSDPVSCIEELGFNSISDYISSKQDEQKIVESKARMIFSGFLNKDYFRKNKCKN